MSQELKVLATMDREEIEQRWIAMNRDLVQIQIAMRNSALGAVYGNRQAHDQYITLRERFIIQEREINMWGYALSELDEMTARGRMEGTPEQETEHA
jgi:hypothetical protein